MWNFLLKRLYFVKEIRNACSELHEERALVQNKNKDIKRTEQMCKVNLTRNSPKILGMKNVGRSSEKQKR